VVDLRESARRAGREVFTMWKRWVPLLSLALGIMVAVPVAVMATTPNVSSTLDKQAALFRSTTVSTTSQTFSDVPGLSNLIICAINEVSVTVSVGITGGEMSMQVTMDGAGALQPGAVHFNPADGTSGFTFTYVANAGTFEGNDNHAFGVQWRSTNGAKVNLNRGVMNLQYQTGTSC